MTSFTSSNYLLLRAVWLHAILLRERGLYEQIRSQRLLKEGGCVTRSAGPARA